MNNVILQAHDLLKTAGFDYAICGGFGIEMYADKELRSHGDFDIAVFLEDRQKAVQFLLDNDWPVYGRFMEEGPIWQYLFYKINDITDSFWGDCRNIWTVKPGSIPEMYKLHRLQRSCSVSQTARTCNLADCSSKLSACQSNLEVYSYKQPSEWHVKSLDFIEFAFDVREENEYVAMENPRIARSLDKAILYHDGIPYLAPEIILYYKSGKYSSENAYAKPRTEIDFKAIMPILPEESKKWLLDAIDATYPGGYGWLEWLFAN